MTQPNKRSIASGAAAGRNLSNARPIVTAAIPWPIPATYRPAVELKAHQNWDPIAAAIRNVEFKYPTPDELAEVGPDNIKLFADHLIDGEHLAEAEVEDLKKEIQQIVDDAVAFASQSAQPTMDAAWGHLNRNQRHEVLM